ncbi:MAG: hypothetical protein ABJV04_02800 [Aliiglaciecola sp.]|uniref:hypothetical protein n=1 Tax=Aliiglaciecola sp. TaxID=1872441 RepID=UPI0032981563
MPHFTTIAAFISGRRSEIELVFDQVLLICHERGLLGNELFAIDDCDMSSNAAKEWSGTSKELEEKWDKLKPQINYHKHNNLDSHKLDLIKKQNRAVLRRLSETR